MREFKVLASLALALMLFVDSSTMAQDFGEWVQKGAEGGNVGALAINPVTPSTLNTVTFELSSGQGVFRSRDGGGTWAAINSGLTHLFISALAIDPLEPSTLYAGTYTGGMFRSRDGGDSWAAINTGLTHPFIFILAIDPLEPSTLYAGTFNFARRVFRRRDGEDTWAAISQRYTLEAGYTGRGKGEPYGVPWPTVQFRMGTLFQASP